MLNRPTISLDAKLDVTIEAILFLVRHSPTPNLADAFVADLHRAFGADPVRRALVDDLAARLRSRDEWVAENDA